MSKLKFKQHTKTIGMIGLLIPVFILIGISTFFLILNPLAFENIDELPISAFNIEEIPGHNWMKYFVYRFNGFLIVLFSLGMLVTTKNKTIDIIAKISLLISGLLWMSFGYSERNLVGFNTDFGIIIACTFLALGFGVLAFILFAAGTEFNSPTERKISKRALLLLAIYILTETMLGPEINGSPIILNYSSWIAYFIGIATLGTRLIQNSNENTNNEVSHQILDHDLS